MNMLRGESGELRKFRQIYLSNTVHCCPECGGVCVVSEPSYVKDDIEPSAADLICPKCGKTHITRDDRAWVTDSGIPYIPGMNGNYATLLYRYGDKIPDTKEGFDELIELLVAVSNGYRDNCDLTGQLEVERRLNNVLKEAIKQMFDYTSQLFLNLASIIQCLNDLGDGQECSEAIDSGLRLCMQSHAVDACTFALMMTEFEMTPSNLNEMKKVYVMLRDKDLSTVPGMKDRTFAAGMYYNMLSEVARYLNLESDYDKLLDMSLNAYLKDASNSMDASDLSMISACFESNIIYSSRTDKETLAERYVEFTDRYRAIDDFQYYNALLRRHVVEADKWGDLHGKDDDLDRIIERFAGCDDPEERHIYANALLFRSVFDLDSLDDLEEAYGAMISNLRDGEQFDDLMCSILKSYLARIKAVDAARYRAEIKKLNQLGISLNMINDWYDEMSSE